MNTGGFMFDQNDVIFIAWIIFSAVSLIIIHKNNQRQAIKVKNQDKMREEFEKFLDGSQK